MEQFEPINQQAPAKRPVLLSVIGILTYVNLGICALGLLLSLMHGRKTPTEMDTLLEPSRQQIELSREQGAYWLADQMDRYLSSQVNGNNAFGLQMFLDAAFIGLGIAGVQLMFRRKRLGFHFYIISCLLRVGAFYIISPLADVSSLIIGYYAFTSILFIILYSRCLSWANE